MIKLFRNIRKNLLTEGKTSKYLKYAVGEIVLVVVGILIALQINNWNENRIALNTKNQYFQQLQKEIELDINTINTQLKNLEGDINLYNTYVSIYETPNIPLDTIYNNIKKLPPNYNLAGFNTKTIEVLKSTGDIKLFSNEIQTLLVTLETEQEEYLKYTDDNYGIYLNTVNETYLINVLSIERHLSNQELLSEALNFKNKLANQLAMQHLAYSVKNYADKNASLSLNKILKTVNELKLLIEKESK